MPRDTRIEVIATTISGSIKDWSKVERIRPLFAAAGWERTGLAVATSHAEARESAAALAADGVRHLISAGGSGTFAAVLEGCCDSGVPLEEIRLGFLRKGSADLLGKALGMPDGIEEAVEVLAAALDADRWRPCDLLQASSASEEAGVPPPRHFVGYGGAELFGRIPHFTESRFTKWYKGLLSQFFGDLGPFTTGMALAIAERMALLRRSRQWRIVVDGEERARGRYQAHMILNGYLGPDLAFTRDPLGSGHFHLFSLRDRGLRRLLGQARATRSGQVMEDPGRWGMESYTITDRLELRPDGDAPFPLNVDGATLVCRGAAFVRRVGQVRLLAGPDDLAHPE